MRNILILTFCIVIASKCYGQNNISTVQQKAIIEKISNEISKFYFSETVAKSISDTLDIIKMQIKTESTIDYFTNTINNLLINKSKDNHLKIYYDPNKFESYADNELTKRKYEFDAAEKINFGFSKVEILEGNVGYIEIIKF